MMRVTTRRMSTWVMSGKQRKRLETKWYTLEKDDENSMDNES